MTPEQYEIAAREYCRLRDLDPDELISHGHPQYSTLAVLSPRWKLEASALEDFDLRLRAVVFADPSP